MELFKRGKNGIESQRIALSDNFLLLWETDYRTKPIYCTGGRVVLVSHTEIAERGGENI